MHIVDDARMVRPPAPPQIDDDQIRFYLEEMNSWANAIANALDEHERAAANVINGLLSRPTPYVSEHTGNILTDFVVLQVDEADLNGPVLSISHNLQVVPKFFQIYALYNHGDPPVLLDQVLSSDHENPVSPGYTAADVITSTTIDGNPAAPSRWSANGVLAGDLIWLQGETKWREITAITAGPPETLTIATPTLVTGTGIPYVIRRPWTETTAFIRVMAENPGFVLALLGFE